MKPTDAFPFDFGRFEGFSFRAQAALDRLLTAGEVAAWNHDEDGEAEFWPSGDHEGVALLFKEQDAVTATELQTLARLLEDLGGDSEDNFLRIHFATAVLGLDLEDLTADGLDESPPYIFTGGNFTDVRRAAAYELFEVYYPELYHLWESTPCDGLHFDTDRFLDSPSWTVAEARLGSRAVLLVAPQ